MSKIVKHIECCRQELNALYVNEGNISAVVLKKSQELDRLINDYYAKMNNGNQETPSSTKNVNGEYKLKEEHRLTNLLFNY